MQLTKQERMWMNKAEPITDLATCKDTVQTAV